MPILKFSIYADLKTQVEPEQYNNVIKSEAEGVLKSIISDAIGSEDAEKVKVFVRIVDGEICYAIDGDLKFAPKINEAIANYEKLQSSRQA